MAGEEAEKLVGPMGPGEDNRKIWDVFYGVFACPALIVAHELKLFPLLAREPTTLPAISAALGLSCRPTRVLLAVMESQGCVVRRNERYLLTPLAEDYLLDTSPTYFGGYLEWIRDNYGVWSVDAVRAAILNNEPQAYAGDDIYVAHAGQSRAARRFTEAMHARSIASASVWPKALDLSRSRVLLDVGGGSGAHCIGAVSCWPHLKAIVYDLESVCGMAEDFIAQHGLGDRVTTHAGDFWKDPFPAADIHFFSSVYQDWPEERCRALTQKSFDSLTPGGRIILHQYLYNDDRSGPFAVAASDLVMLLWTKGGLSSGPELTAMLEEVGFVDLEVKPTFGYFSIVTGCKPVAVGEPTIERK